jgi:PPOX class probable F420-dependent enzyme
VVHALDAAGHVVVSTRSRSVKVRNLQRDPRVTLCVLPDTFFGKWIVVDGSARIVGLPDAMDGLVDLYRQVAGEHPDWDDFRAAMVREERVLVTVSVERVGPDGTA